jgi:hypothetical protein
LLHEFNDLLSSDLTTIIKFDPMYLPTGINLKDTVEWQISRDTIKSNDQDTLSSDMSDMSRENVPLSIIDQGQVDPIDQPINLSLDSNDPVDRIINNINNHTDYSVSDHSKPSPPYLREGRIAKTNRKQNNKLKTRRKNKKKNMQFLPGDVFSPDSPTDPPHDQESKGLDELTPTDQRDQEQGGLLQTTSRPATTDHNQERNGLTGLPQATSHAAPPSHVPVILEESSSEDENENDENDENVKILRSGKHVRFA